MKKAIFAALAVLGMGLLLTSAGKNKVVSLKGHINYYGNAPFEQPGFKTDEGEVLAMSVADGAGFTLQDVLNMQGHYLQLDGTVEKAALDIQPVGARGTIFIHAYKDVSPKEAAPKKKK